MSRLSRPSRRIVSPMILLLVAVFSFGSDAQPAQEDQAAADDTFGLQEAVGIQDAGSGSLLLRTTGAGLFLRAPMLETDVAIDVTGVVARTVVRQRFRNPHDLWLEGVYVFPLPDDAAVDAMRLVVGERIIEGEIQEREQAKRTYEAAKSSGRRASLVQQERPNLFTTSVANLGPGEGVDVVIEYQQELRYDDGRFGLRFPMVVNPRYSPSSVGPGESARLGAPRIHQTEEERQTAQKNGSVLNPVNLAVTIDLGMPVVGIESPSHLLALTPTPEGSVIVQPSHGVVPADRDFVLAWRVARGEEPRAAIFRRDLGGDTYLLVWLVPPSDDAAESLRLPRETTFVLDRSGSMSGASIVQARHALLDALDRLPPGDTFNLVDFSGSARRLFEVAVPATEPYLTTARRHVQGLRADGGTEMLGALRLALRDGEGPDPIAEEGRVRQLIFITDGSVSNEDQLFDYLQQTLGDRRLFTVGIGSAPNRHFMRRAAEHGRGTHTYISSPDEVGERMGELFAKIDTPVLADLRLLVDDRESGAEGGGEIYPRRPGDLYLGEPLVFAVRSPSEPRSVRVEGWRGEVPFTRELDATSASLGPGVDKLWARRKIDALETSDSLDDEARGQAIVDVALRHHLVSKHTSLVAVDRTPVREVVEELTTDRLPLHTPSGWTPPILPTTGTTATLRLALGLLLMTLAVWWGRRGAL